MAAHEACIGHGKLAVELRDIVEKAKKQVKSTAPVSIAKGLKDSSGLLNATTSQVKLGDLVTTDEVNEKLIRIIQEQRHLGKIKSHGLAPRRRLLLIGPPGTGKTFTTSVLASDLGYPLFQVRLDAVITKFMGESAAKLRQVFDSIREFRGVYFFDEFDALGTQRAVTNNVGEARRILNSFLQMIEQDDSNSIILCATNHPKILDYALFRRFDDVIQYRLPGKEEIATLFRSKLKRYADKYFRWSDLAENTKGLSSTEVTYAAQDAIKKLLIHEHEVITMKMVAPAIEDRRAMSHEIHR